MKSETIHTVININGYTLAVFYTQAKCWQFRVISPGGSSVHTFQVQPVVYFGFEELGKSY